MIKTVTMNPAVDKTVEIDNFRVGAVNRITSVRLDAGGKGINVSKTIKALKGISIATGVLAGRNGEYIKSYLDHLDICSDFLFINGETRTNLKVVDKFNHTNTDINEPGPEVSKEDLGLLETRIFSGMSKDSILVLSGSVPPNVSKDVYKEWIERAKKQGIRVLLDSDGELLREGIKAGPYLIKPNIAEFERLLGRKLAGINEIVSAAKKIIDIGIEMVVVSLGAEGAVFVGKDKVIHTEGLSVKARSTVGAGDAMVASLALSLDRDYDFERAVTLSVAAAAVSAATEGTQPPGLEDVLRCENQVRCSYLR